MLKNNDQENYNSSALAATGYILNILLGFRLI